MCTTPPFRAAVRLNSGVSRLMKKIVASLLILGSSFAMAGESPAVDTRLAKAIEAAALATGFDINISQSTKSSVNINTVNGRNVCDTTAIEDVRKFQDAIAQQPYVKDNFGPAYYSVTAQDGTRKMLSSEELIKRGTLKGCTAIYVSVAQA